ncbi:EamA family transporter [Streptomyces sp. NPDC059697]|uniref:EamA family transporter n=1 Tax=Streptomyces sp. NPDC059697 TaxID=3346912 RepID=UPI0036B06009
MYFILENVGVDLSTASDTSLIVATYPLMTMLVELVALRTRVSLPRVTGVLLAAVGTFIVVRNGAEVGGSSRRLGDILLLVHLAVACSVGGFLLCNYGLRRMASSVAVNILNLVPVFGVIGAVVING